MDEEEPKKLDNEELREARLKALGESTDEDEEQEKDEKDDQEKVKPEESDGIAMDCDPAVLQQIRSLIWPNTSGEDDIQRWHSQGFEFLFRVILCFLQLLINDPFSHL